eukprot:PLAT5850.1.p1 GENE.PLAT5850.1~~PLAT5850.1.p1  ORF type:complete len:393 (-),score=184.15 PLAT5850.1:136-1290(-)
MSEGEAGVPLSEEAARAGLSGLGRSAVLHGRHALLKLRVVDAGIGSIEVLRSLPHLQEVVLDDNSLRSLAPLASLPCLSKLSAAGNQLTDILPFSAPRCSEEDAWEEGDSAVGSALVTADLSRNCIEEMPDSLGAHAFLRELLLAHNRISSIRGLRGLKHLALLDLSHNALTSLAGLQDLPLRELRVAGNELTSLAGLRLPTLQKLVASDNSITSFRGLEDCVALRELDVRNNLIATVWEAEYVRLPCLQHLQLNGNAVQSRDFYRKRILFRLPQLETLDGDAVDAKAVVKAMNLYGADVAHRAEVFDEAFPGEPFEDLLPPFVESKRDEAEFFAKHLSMTAISAAIDGLQAVSATTAAKVAGKLAGEVLDGAVDSAAYRESVG